jgi:predicted metal-dependent hydrolase
MGMIQESNAHTHTHTHTHKSVEEMTQGIKRLVQNHKALDSDCHHEGRKQDLAINASYPSTRAKRQQDPWGSVSSDKTRCLRFSERLCLKKKKGIITRREINEAIR